MVQFLDDGLEGEALLSGESGGAADGILGVSLVTVRGMLEYGTTSSIGNYTGVSTSEGFYYFPTRWEPLHEPDYVMLVFTAVHQLVMLAVVVHLVWRRDWPPYVTKKITLVAATGVGSTLSLLGNLVAYGAIRRRGGETLATCGVEALLRDLGTALHLFPAFVRVYRNYTLLILHSASMWSAMVQLQAVSLLYLVPAFVYLAKPDMAEFEEYRNICFDHVWMDIAAFLYVALGISGAIMMVVRMRRVRKQLNEFRLMTTSLAFLLIWSLYLLPAGQWMGRGTPTIPRRLVMTDNFVSTVVLFWCPIAIPFVRYLQKDEEYVSQFTFGFSRLPTPAQMRASLADQLGVDQLRKKFRKYAAGRVAPELPDFYKACMDRELVEGYFERQAITMAIIDQFIADGADQQVNISDQCRRRVLDSEITRYNIFDEAIAEVLNVMEVNFKADFERSMEYRRLNRAVEREAKELSVLRQAKLVAGTKNAEREAARRPTPYGSTRSSWPTPREHVRGVSELSLDNSDSAGNAVGLMEEGFSATGGVHPAEGSGTGCDIFEARGTEQGGGSGDTSGRSLARQRSPALCNSAPAAPPTSTAARTIWSLSARSRKKPPAKDLNSFSSGQDTAIATVHGAATDMPAPMPSPFFTSSPRLRRHPSSTSFTSSKSASSESSNIGGEEWCGVFFATAATPTALKKGGGGGDSVGGEAEEQGKSRQAVEESSGSDDQTMVTMPITTTTSPNLQGGGPPRPHDPVGDIERRGWWRTILLPKRIPARISVVPVSSEEGVIKATPVGNRLDDPRFPCRGADIEAGDSLQPPYTPEPPQPVVCRTSFPEAEGFESGSSAAVSNPDVVEETTPTRFSRDSSSNRSISDVGTMAATVTDTTSIAGDAIARRAPLGGGGDMTHYPSPLCTPVRRRTQSIAAPEVCYMNLEHRRHRSASRRRMVYLRGDTRTVDDGGSNKDSCRYRNPRTAAGMLVGSENHHLHAYMTSRSVPTTPISSYAGAHAGSRRPLPRLGLQQDGQDYTVAGCCGGQRHRGRVRSVSVDSVASTVAWPIGASSDGLLGGGSPGPTRRERAWSDAADTTTVAMAAAVIVLDGGAVDEDLSPSRRGRIVASGGGGGGGCARRNHRSRSLSNLDSMAVAVASISPCATPWAGRGGSGSTERIDAFCIRAAGLGRGGGSDRPTNETTTSSTSGSSPGRRPTSGCGSRSSTTMSGAAPPRPPSPLAKTRPLVHDRGRRSSSVGNLMRRCRSASPFASAGSCARASAAAKFGRAAVAGYCRSSSSSSSGGWRRKQHSGDCKSRSRSMYEYSSGGIIRVVDDNGLCTLRQPRSLASPLSQQEASGGGGDRNTSYMRIESSRRGTAGGHSCVFTAHTVANDREGSTASSSGGGDKLGEGKEQRGGGVGSDGRRQLHRGDTRRWSRHWGGNTTVGYVSADSSTSTSTTNNSVFSARSTDDSDEFASNDGGRRQAAAVAVDQWLGKDTDGRHHHGDVEAEVMNASSGSVSVSSDDSAALERYEDYLSTSARTRGWTLTGPGGRAVPCEHGAELYVAAPASSTASYYYYHNVEA